MATFDELVERVAISNEEMQSMTDKSDFILKAIETQTSFIKMANSIQSAASVLITDISTTLNNISTQLDNLAMNRSIARDNARENLEATDVSGGIGSAFAGFFKDGGTIPPRQFGVVGENGPELVSGPATITPNARAFMGGSANDSESSGGPFGFMAANLINSDILKTLKNIKQRIFFL